MTATLDEDTLVRSAQRGDLEAFNRLVDRYQDLLFRIAYRMLGDDNAAADAAQAAWLSAFRKINEQHGGRFSSWLVRILTNACYDELRKRHRRGEVPLWPVDDDGEDRDTADWLADHAPSVEQQVDARQMDRFIEQALQLIPAAYRSMIILVDLEGFGYEQAAAALHVPLGTVRSRLARGRLALRRQLLAAGALPPEHAGSPAVAPQGIEARFR